MQAKTIKLTTILWGMSGLSSGQQIHYALSIYTIYSCCVASKPSSMFTQVKSTARGSNSLLLLSTCTLQCTNWPVSNHLWKWIEIEAVLKPLWLNVHSVWTQLMRINTTRLDHSANKTSRIGRCKRRLPAGDISLPCLPTVNTKTDTKGSTSFQVSYT